MILEIWLLELLQLDERNLTRYMWNMELDASDVLTRERRRLADGNNEWIKDDMLYWTRNDVSVVSEIGKVYSVLNSYAQAEFHIDAGSAVAAAGAVVSVKAQSNIGMNVAAVANVAALAFRDEKPAKKRQLLMQPNREQELSPGSSATNWNGNAAGSQFQKMIVKTLRPNCSVKF
jgi:hypothetical protein